MPWSFFFNKPFHYAFLIAFNHRTTQMHACMYLEPLVTADGIQSNCSRERSRIVKSKAPCPAVVVVHLATLMLQQYVQFTRCSYQTQ